jgi:hypothetical protein
MWQQLLAHHHALMLIGLDPGLLSEIDPPNLADWSETVGLGRVGEFEIHAPAVRLAGRVFYRGENAARSARGRLKSSIRS